MRRGASFDTCFALSASICIIAGIMYWTIYLVWLCISREIDVIQDTDF